MEVKVAASAGFCFGVKRAVDLVYEETEKSQGRVYTMGPIIHNEQVVSDLEKRGVRIIGDDHRPHIQAVGRHGCETEHTSLRCHNRPAV